MHLFKSAHTVCALRVAWSDRARRASLRVHRGAAALLWLVTATLAYSQDPVPGSLDLSFGSGSGKIANLAIGGASDRAHAMVLQADGKIVLAGQCSSADLCLARTNADGSLDVGFDGPSGSGNGKFVLAMGARTDLGTAMVLQPDGKIVVAGTCPNAGNDDFCVARLNTDGSLDTTFVGPSGNGNGKFLLPIGASDDTATAIALQPDGKILLAGTCLNGVNANFCVARLNADGTFDVSFDGPSGTSNGKFLFSINAVADAAQAIALQPDGKIILAGTCYSGSNFDFCLARLNADGSFDANFDGPSGGGNGKFMFSFNSFLDTDSINSIVLQPNGKIVLAGECYNATDLDFCLARLNVDGTLDTTFDGPSGGSNGAFLLPIGSSNDSASAVALQPDGKIVLAGLCANGSNDDFCVVRLNTDGSLDGSFDGPSGAGNGKFLLPVGTGNDRAKAIALQPDGKIVLAGSCGTVANDDFCVARLHGGPFGAKLCSFDLDGDGKVLATTDMLIGARVALGLRGSATLNGITFAAHATRTTWPDIRTFLVSQCGMTIAP